jgi:hypothetical protein
VQQDEDRNCEQHQEGREHVLEEGRCRQCDEEKEEDYEHEHVLINGPARTGRRPFGVVRHAVLRQV